jgi:hypothetical protein
MRSANFWTVAIFISLRRTQWGEPVRFYSNILNQNDWSFPVYIFRDRSWREYPTILQIIEKFRWFSMPSYMKYRVAIFSTELASFSAITYREPDSLNTMLVEGWALREPAGRSSMVEI